MKAPVQTIFQISITLLRQDEVITSLLYEKMKSGSRKKKGNVPPSLE